MANYPQRVGEPDCRDFLRTGRCKYGDSCKYHHPLGGVKANDPNEPPFPIRPGEPNCQYYLKNATCKFGQTCKFHHPPHIMLAKGGNNMMNATSRGNPNTSNTGCTIISMESGGEKNQSITSSNDRGTQKEFRDILPQRPGEPDCIYYLRNGRCKYGASCKYHHPSPSGNDTFSPNSRLQSLNNPSILKVERSNSEIGTDGHEMRRSFIAAAMQRHQSNPMFESVHRKLQIQNQQSQSILGTIDNPYQQFPQGAMDMNNVTPGGGSFPNFSNGSGASSKIGSPSMSSTTVASSYDTAASGLETLPPPRVQVPAQNTSSLIGSPNPNQGLHAQLNLYSSEISKLPLHQVSKGQYLSRTNSRDEVGPLYLSNNINDSSGMTNVRSLNDIQQQQSQQQQFLVGRHPRRTSHSSITSIASQSPTTDFNDPFQQELNRTNITRNRRSIDDGLSMMTDALLTMLDTPDEGSQGDKRNIFVNRRDVNDTSLTGIRSTSSSLPDYLLTSNSARTSQIKMNPSDYAMNYGLNFRQESNQRDIEPINQSRIANNHGYPAPSPGSNPPNRQRRPSSQFFIPS
eukprot:CAMPEP_0203668896 /NCGR_PEP_ID=MMETSP0090-20130426/5407_1 /ASSEMBLY_ACC=CAM_ASM_001088 /TAXON_ID=426623 /ORGANISM="Chaetoceros affinis, Strain CCMP159" /LENGTH=570 /DNA_ID=CAMNT_0050533451 /DNA_START=649 /DNA_END=2361 /DNA_ORIENTATION=-